MKSRQTKTAQNNVSDNMADNLIETLLGEKVPISRSPGKNILDSGLRETYQLPVQIGQAGKALSRGDKPWIVGTFSPGVPTDKNHPKGHNGVDLKAARGIPVYPIASGVVKEIGSGGISGNFVMCLHEDGSVQSFYGHLDSIRVGRGQPVNQATPLGTVGDTGNAKGRGPHLHYEVKVNGILVNPLGIPGKQVGSLSKKAFLLSSIHKLANKFELLASLNENFSKKAENEMKDIKINNTEQKIFDLLMQVVAEKAPGTVLRTAGGWVRDKLMGKDSQDIDIAVDRMSGQAFATLVFNWMQEHGVPIDHKMAVVKSNPDKSKHLETTILPIFGIPIDFVQLRKETYDTDGQQSRIPTIDTDNVSAEDDALRRDFTVNSMFYNLNEGKVEDLTGRGMEDLQKGILRTPLDPVVTFLQDPLRILRAIRFAAKYGLELDPNLIKAARDPRVQKAFMEKLAHERIWKEMVGVQETEGFKRGFLTGPDPAKAAHLMNILGIRDLLFTLSEEEKDRLGIKQDETTHWDADQNTPHHNLNIWEHTLEAMKHLANIARDSNIDEGKENKEVEEAVRHLSVLLHDIGKCDLCSRQRKEDGTFSYLGHAESSAKMAEYILEEKFKAPKEITQRVKNIIFNHMRLHVLEDHPSDSALRRVLKDIGDDWQNLVYHSLADAMGKRDAVEDPKYRAMVERLVKLKAEQGGSTKPKRPIDGNIIMNELGLKPGPHIKQITDALDEALLENPTMTPEEALSFIKTVPLKEITLSPRGKAFVEKAKKAGIEILIPQEKQLLPGWSYHQYPNGDVTLIKT